MTERERLVELIKNSHLSTNSTHLADYLLKNGVIVPPCKVGDTVYILDFCQIDDTDGYYYVDERKVESITFAENACWYNLQFPFSSHYIKDFGNTVFLTREEAEAGLNEMQKKA